MVGDQVLLREFKAVSTASLLELAVHILQNLLQAITLENATQSAIELS